MCAKFPDISPAPIAVGRQAEIFPYEDGRVLKLFRGDWPGAAEHEIEIARIAYDGGAITPQPFEIVRVNDRPGIIFERVDGISLLEAIKNQPWRVKALAQDFSRLHHTVHQCRATELHAARPALEQLIKERDELTPTLKTALLKRLETLPGGDSLLHGDFHAENVMVTPSRMVIVDWPNAARGCPIADVARSTIILRVGEPPDPPLYVKAMIRVLGGLFQRAYLQAYFAESPYTLDDLARWEPILAVHRLSDGISGEAEKLVNFIRRSLDV